jgi:PIN domain nuclease of toxin-antitoxin system
MEFLLDTQVMIWALEDNPKLKPVLKALIVNSENTVLVSQFSLMEIAIKLKLGKLPDFIIEIDHLTNQLLSDGFDILPISNTHIAEYQSLPLFEEHRDPFNRFLLATTFSMKIPIISADEKFTLYRPFITVVDGR